MPVLPDDRYGVRMKRVRWFYAKFRYWTDAIAYAKSRQSTVDRHEPVVIVRLVAMRANHRPNGTILPANSIVWTGTPEGAAMSADKPPPGA